MVPALSGSMTLKDATNEAMRHWINNPTETHYIIGSVVGPHPYPDMVSRFQSIISEEIKKQLQEEIGNPFPTTFLLVLAAEVMLQVHFIIFLIMSMLILWQLKLQVKG